MKTQRNMVMIEKLTGADFRPHLNQTFRIHRESSEPLESKLIEVSDVGPGPREGDAGTRRRPFSILLRGPVEPVLRQAIYRIEHAEMGALDLFLVPIGPDNQGMRYEAVFN